MPKWLCTWYQFDFIHASYFSYRISHEICCTFVDLGFQVICTSCSIYHFDICLCYIFRFTCFFSYFIMWFSIWMETIIFSILLNFFQLIRAHLFLLVVWRVIILHNQLQKMTHLYAWCSFLQEGAVLMCMSLMESFSAAMPTTKWHLLLDMFLGYCLFLNFFFISFLPLSLHHIATSFIFGKYVKCSIHFSFLASPFGICFFLMLFFIYVINDL